MGMVSPKSKYVVYCIFENDKDDEYTQKRQKLFFCQVPLETIRRVNFLSCYLGTSFHKKKIHDL